MSSNSEEVKCSPNALRPLRFIGVVVALLGLYLSTASMELAVHRHYDGRFFAMVARPTRCENRGGPLLSPRDLVSASGTNQVDVGNYE